jgi:hypothetical protein
MIKNMVSVLLGGTMGESILANGIKESNMEWENTLQLVGKAEKENGLMGKD